MTRESVRKLVRKAEFEFHWCWALLASLRHEMQTVQARDLATWQPRLAKTLFALEDCYHQSKQQDRALIKRKAAVTSQYLRARLRRSRDLRGVLDRTIDVGKALGDAFAWPFYCREHKLLSDHQKRPRITRSPIGTGGIGEITYLENLPVVNNFIVIYHGTTTFLRLGDVSFIEMDSMKVVAIGELKSYRSGPTEIQITVNLVGSRLQKELIPRLPTKPRRKIKPGRQLDAAQLARLQRQMTAIGTAFGAPTRPEIQGADIMADWNTDKVIDLARVSTKARAGYVKVGRGLILMGLRVGMRTLWSAFTSGSKSNFMPQLEGLGKVPREIVDKALPDNSLTIGWLVYPSTGRYELLPGMRPVGCWPITQEIAKDLIFRRLAVMTMFNPAFLIKELRDRGFSVTCEKGALSVSRPYRGQALVFAGFEYFISMIQRHLLSEPAVIQMVENFTSTLDSNQVPVPATVRLDPRFDYN